MTNQHELASEFQPILIVDDNDDAGVGYASRFVQLGHEVRVANDGPSALEVARRFRPEVALLDIGLPVMDGYELAHRLRELALGQFAQLLEQVTSEFQQFLRVLEMSNNAAFESMLEQVLEAFTLKIGDLLHADRASLFLVDETRSELWSKVAQHEGERPLEIRLPVGAGIAGHVARTGATLNVPDAYAEPLFRQEVDRETGYRTRTILCAPMRDSHGQTFAVAQLLNKRTGEPFDALDERRLREFAGAVGVIVETWRDMSACGPGPARAAG